MENIHQISVCLCLSTSPPHPLTHTQIIFLRSATVSLKYQRSKENGDGSSRKLASEKQHKLNQIDTQGFFSEK